MIFQAVLPQRVANGGKLTVKMGSTDPVTSGHRLGAGGARVTQKLTSPQGSLSGDLSAGTAGTGPVVVRRPDQKLVRLGVARHSPAAASLGPAPNGYSLGKEQCRCWHTSSAGGAVLGPVTVTADPVGCRRLINFAHR